MKMPFGEYLESIANTEQETEFFGKLEGLKVGLSQAPTNIPFLGKIVAALVVLCDCQDVAEFKQTPEYDMLADWKITINPDHGGFSLTPSPAIRNKMIRVAVAAVVGVILAIVWFKRRRRK